MDFNGDGWAFIRYALLGAILQFVTAGFYRFWFITNIRRRLWSQTMIGGDRFEYTGRGRELLIGFLFAVAILGPVYAAYFVVGLEAERYKAFASFPLILFFYLFGQFAVFRARRYRLTRTVWRGVRFWMTGSGVKFALMSAGWTLVVFLTLGAALPWREASLERYKMRNLHFGDLQADFAGSGRDLFAAGFWTYAAFVLFVLAPAAALLATVVRIGLETGWANPNTSMRVMTEARGLFLYEMLASPLVTGIVAVLYQGVEWRWWLNGLRFGQVSVVSEFRRGQIVWLYFAHIGMLVITGGGAIILGIISSGILSALGLMPRFNNPNDIHIGLLAGIAAIYLIVLSLISVSYRYFFQFALWREVVGSLTIMNLDALDAVTARGAASSALGEGLADGLDVAGF